MTLDFLNMSVDNAEASALGKKSRLLKINFIWCHSQKNLATHSYILFMGQGHYCYNLD